MIIRRRIHQERHETTRTRKENAETFCGLMLRPYGLTDMPTYGLTEGKKPEQQSRFRPRVPIEGNGGFFIDKRFTLTLNKIYTQKNALLSRGRNRYRYRPLSLIFQILHLFFASFVLALKRQAIKGLSLRDKKSNPLLPSKCNLLFLKG